MDDGTRYGAEGIADWLDDWQTGRRLNTRGRNKIVLAAGMLSRSGEALKRFDGFIRYLMTNHGYEAGDFLECLFYRLNLITLEAKAPRKMAIA